jgi:hypothetical protein
MLSIVIPARNEPLAWWTIRQIWRTQDAPTAIILVDDASDHPYDPTDFLPEIPAGSQLHVLRHDKPLGNGPSRDYGICAAPTNIVLILDAHCNFNADGWTTAMLRWGAALPEAICCTRSVQLSSYDMRLEMSQGKGHPYCGAYIKRTQRTSNGEFRVLQGVWTRRQDVRAALAVGQPAEIGCVMGGAYVLSRSRYMSTLRQPWAYLRGWGTSEPTICMINACMGGNSMILPIDVGHDYRSGQQHLVPYRTELVYIRQNQFFLARCLYEPGSNQFTELLRHMAQNGDSQGVSMATHRTTQKTGGNDYADWLRLARTHDPDEVIDRFAAMEPAI